MINLKVRLITMRAIYNICEMTVNAVTCRERYRRNRNSSCEGMNCTDTALRQNGIIELDKQSTSDSRDDGLLSAYMETSEYMSE